MVPRWVPPDCRGIPLGVGAHLKSRSQSGHAGYNLDPRVALASQSNVGAFSSECIIQTAGFMMSLLPNP